MMNDYFTCLFIKTGDPALNETSTDLLTDSLKYEIEAFKAIETPQ